jgi:hypothetical protein
VLHQTGLKEHIAYDGVAERDDGAEGPGTLVGLEDGVQRGLAEVLVLDLDEFVDVVLELVGLELAQVVGTQDHVLDQLSDFLVKLYHVGLPVHEVLDRLPVFELVVQLGLLRASSEGRHHFAQDLGCGEGLVLGLLNSQDDGVEIQTHFGNSLHHLLLYFFAGQELGGHRGIWLELGVTHHEAAGPLGSVVALTSATLGVGHLRSHFIHSVASESASHSPLRVALLHRGLWHVGSEHRPNGVTMDLFMGSFCWSLFGNGVLHEVMGGSLRPVEIVVGVTLVSV